LEILRTQLPDVLLISPKVFGDERGFFLESWQIQRYAAFNIPGPKGWAQDNVSRSARGVLRGLHFQFPTLQGKLITVLEGEIFDVAVDIRKKSPTFGKWTGHVLSAKNIQQLWVPKGFAHGFLVMSESAVVSYKASDLYTPAEEKTLLWNDPELSIQWPCDVPPQLSEKDQQGICLSAISPSLLPEYTP